MNHFRLAGPVPPRPRMPFWYVVWICKTYLLTKGHAGSRGTHPKITVIAAFYSSPKMKWKQNGNETKTPHKRSFGNAFLSFFRNVLTFSQWNGKNGFQLNAFFFFFFFFFCFSFFFRNVLRLASEMAKGFISRNFVVWPTFLRMNVFTALKGSHFWFLFDFTAAGFVPYGGRKTSPRTSTIVQFIFYFGPLRSAIIFWEIRNKWLVKTHILDRFLFIWTSFWFISVFESTAYLKFAKLQYVSSGFRCRVITGSLMRLY